MTMVAQWICACTNRKMKSSGRIVPESEVNLYPRINQLLALLRKHEHLDITAHVTGHITIMAPLLGLAF